MIYFCNTNDISKTSNQLYVFSNYLLSKFKPGFKRKLRIKKRAYALWRYLSTVDFLSDYYNTGKTLKPIQNIMHIYSYEYVHEG